MYKICKYIHPVVLSTNANAKKEAKRVDFMQQFYRARTLSQPIIIIFIFIEINYDKLF